MIINEWNKTQGTRDTAAMFLCTSYFYPINNFKQPVQLAVLMYTPPCISLCLFMKNNTFSIFLLMLLLMLLIIIQLLAALLCYTLAYCMHSYTSCSSKQTVSSRKKNKVGKQFMMKNSMVWFILFQSRLYGIDKNS